MINLEKNKNKNNNIRKCLIESKVCVKFIKWFKVVKNSFKSAKAYDTK